MSTQLDSLSSSIVELVDSCSLSTMDHAAGKYTRRQNGKGLCKSYQLVIKDYHALFQNRWKKLNVHRLIEHHRKCFSNLVFVLNQIFLFNFFTKSIQLAKLQYLFNGKQSTVNKLLDGSMYPASKPAHSTLGKKNHYC
jgi:hypothetical protein